MPTTERATPSQLFESYIEAATLLDAYRKFLYTLGLNPDAVQKVLLGDDAVDTFHKRATLDALRVFLDRNALRQAGYSESAVEQCAAWVRSLAPAMVAREADHV